MHESFYAALADRYLSFSKQLHRESDRGAIIVGAALLEDGLGQLVVARLAASLERDDELFDGHHAPCSTFGAKIDLAYRIGVATSSTRASLHLIRKLRNEAAHVGDHRDFGSPEVQGRVRELFKLNLSLVEGFWHHIKEAAAAHDVALPESPDALAGAVSVVGWRRLWDMLIAMLAAAIGLNADRQKPLPPLEDALRDSSDVMD